MLYKKGFSYKREGYDYGTIVHEFMHKFDCLHNNGEIQKTREKMIKEFLAQQAISHADEASALGVLTRDFMILTEGVLHPAYADVLEKDSTPSQFAHSITGEISTNLYSELRQRKKQQNLYKASQPCEESIQFFQKVMDVEKAHWKKLEHVPKDLMAKIDELKENALKRAEERKQENRPEKKLSEEIVKFSIEQASKKAAEQQKQENTQKIPQQQTQQILQKVQETPKISQKAQLQEIKGQNFGSHNFIRQ
ncbi:hypothetical protein [Candidatus Fokinia solitaria]|uniref:hypothetical protein n=1 Tax=Candidatus Fokinia solitaria TaxID=1802984 RepID=UPI0011AB3E7B|nr:hypothetical protein [Candidatus Fokinia solitaria]